MRVFYLTTEFLWPAHQGGRVRSLAQLRLLAAQPEVSQLTLLSLAEVPVTAAELAALREAIIKPSPSPSSPASGLPQPAVAPRPGLKVDVLPPLPHPIHLKQAPAELLRVAVQRARSGVPYLATKWHSAAVERALTRELSGGGYDLVYLDHLGMALYLQLVRRACPAARIVVDEHNVESDFFAQFAARVPLPLRPLARAEYAAAARFEAATLAAVDAVVAISQLDADALTALTLRHTGQQVVPQVVPQVVQSAEPRRPPPAELRLGYVGNLTWHPNALGLSWFCAAVWPQLQRALPEVRLSIAGSGLALDAQGRPLVPKGWQRPGIEVLGYVAELETLYPRCLGVIAPILGGSGVRIKLLEAFRAGLPVVTTTAGAAGLPVTGGVEVLIEDEPDRFARAILTLCHDPALQQRLRAAGYAFLRAHHSPQRAAAAMRAALGLPASPG